MGKNVGYSVKNEIGNAVMQLMTEKTYMEITVTDIVKKASVARASFYRNFDSIDDVINLIIDEATDEMVEDVFPLLTSSDERKWREFLFNHFYRFKKHKKDMQKMRFENIAMIFTKINSQILQKEMSTQSETIQDKYLVIGKWGLINNILRKWIDTGANETPEEMIDYIMSFITKF